VGQADAGDYPLGTLTKEFPNNSGNFPIPAGIYADAAVP
jgi:hypothetical protein